MYNYDKINVNENAIAVCYNQYLFDLLTKIKSNISNFISTNDIQCIMREALVYSRALRFSGQSILSKLERSRAKGAANSFLLP